MPWSSPCSEFYILYIERALRSFKLCRRNLLTSVYLSHRLLVSSPIIQLWSYNDLTRLSSLHPHHLLALTPNSEGSYCFKSCNTVDLRDCNFTEYVALLSALLIWPFPLGIAMTAGVLPLSQRQQYLPPPSLLQLWYVVEGKYWYSNQDTTGFSLHVIQRCKTPVQLIKEFVERVYYPVMVSWMDDTGILLHQHVTPNLQGSL